MISIIFYSILLIFTFFYLLENFLNFLNLKNLKEDLPAELSEIYRPEEYKKSIQYERETARFEFVSDGFMFVILFSMLWFAGFGKLYNWIETITNQVVWQTLLFFLILQLVQTFLKLPFSYYFNFVIEQKYGFNKMTKTLFITDKLKGLMLSVVLGAVILGSITWFYTLTKQNFWIFAWLVVVFFSLFANLFYSTLIVPLFNKQKPLPEGELRDLINDFSKKINFHVKNVFVIDGSKRSSKANAYFSGLGKKKRIVLYDTLINDLTNNELLAVLAHEAGHYKKKHIQKSLIMSIFQTAIVFYILSVFISLPELSYALGADNQSFAIGIFAFSILFTPIETLLGLYFNWLSRKNEYQADDFANQYGLGAELISALKKLSVNNLSNLNPHKAVVFMHYSHPTLLQRIRAIQTKK